MVEHGRATPQEAAEAKAFDLRVYAVTNPLKASQFIDDQVEPRLVRMCEAGVFSQFDPDEVDCSKAIHGAGWKVTTTLDWAETDKAIQMIQEGIAAGLEAGCNCNNAAIVTIEPTTGEIIIYAPNVNPNDPSTEGPVQGRHRPAQRDQPAGFIVQARGLPDLVRRAKQDSHEPALGYQSHRHRAASRSSIRAVATSSPKG